jgi:hypothetical protein
LDKWFTFEVRYDRGYIVGTRNAPLTLIDVMRVSSALRRTQRVKLDTASLDSHLQRHYGIRGDIDPVSRWRSEHNAISSGFSMVIVGE